MARVLFESYDHFSFKKICFPNTALVDLDILPVEYPAIIWANTHIHPEIDYAEFALS